MALAWSLVADRAGRAPAGEVLAFAAGQVPIWVVTGAVVWLVLRRRAPLRRVLLSPWLLAGLIAFNGYGVLRFLTAG